MTPRKRPRSLLLRYASIHGAIFGALVCAVLFFLYRATLALEEARLDREIETEARQVQSRLAGRTIVERTELIRAVSASLGGRSSVYVLATARREVLAGNIPTWPAPADREGIVEFPLAPAADETANASVPQMRIRGRSIALPAAERLFVGRNLAELDRLRQLFGGTLVGTLAVTLLLGFASAFWLSQRVATRLDEINRTSVAILAGDLRRRIPVGPRGDEFDALSENLNHMLDRIEALMNAMREVTDNVAHDLRSPISRLRSRIEVSLMEAGADRGAYRKVLEQTVAEIDAILAVFNALLTIAEVESGKPRERFTELDLAEIAREGFETFEPVAEEAGIALGLMAQGPLRIRGDRHLLAQAIANLLENAIKYVPRGGHIGLRVECGGGRTRLVIEDDGPGMDADFRARAFDRFTRMERSRTTPGSGLGLSLVRAVARLHGGDVFLEDAQPGLRVTIELDG